MGQKRATSTFEITNRAIYRSMTTCQFNLPREIPVVLISFWSRLYHMTVVEIPRLVFDTASFDKFQHRFKYLQPPKVHVDVMTNVRKRDSLRCVVLCRKEKGERISRHIASARKAIALTIKEVLLAVQQQYRLCEFRRHICGSQGQCFTNSIAVACFQVLCKN
jgi:hypothetical protein